MGQRLRSLEVEYGYRDLVLPDRRMVVDFSADGVGDFTSSDIEEYFALLNRKVGQPILPIVTEKDAVHIRDVTDGVPLAVKIAAGLYVESQSLELITQSLDGKREIVDQMVERYLLHTRTNPADRARLYGLALLRRPDEPRSLAAALDVPDHFDAELSRLHRRYGFIFTKQEKPALHQEVRHFLRLWLLQHRTSSPDILQVVRRLREALLTSFQELEAQRNYASLRERLEDEQWVELYLDLTEQQFWLDSAEGVTYILPFMFAASVYHREARAIGEFFQGKLVQPYRKQWEWANQSLVYSTSRNPLSEELSGLKELVRLASQNRIAFSSPVQSFQEELEAALWWRLGEAYQGKDPQQSVSWYEKGLSRLSHEKDLREVHEEAIWARDHAEIEDESAENRPPEPTALISLEGTAKADSSGAVAPTTSDSQLALIVGCAIDQDPKSIRTYMQRGDAYFHLKEYRRAIADFDRALDLTPQDALLYTKRGDAYFHLKEYRRAVADFDRALAVEPSNEGIRTKQHKAASELAKTQQTSTVPPSAAFVKSASNKNLEENSRNWLWRPTRFVTAFKERSTRHAPPFRLSHRFTTRMKVLLGILTFLLIGGSGLLYYSKVLQPFQQHVQPTATAGSNTNAFNALQATNSAATAAVTINSYDPGSQWTLVPNESLSNNGNSGWDKTSGSCTFTSQGYQVSPAQTGAARVCTAHNTDFSNVTFEVQMKILSGNAGGILFRSTGSASYYFRINQNGNYALLACAGAGTSCNQTLISSINSYINSGLNQSNTIAVVAKGNSIELYVNGEPVNTVNNGISLHGQIGVVAEGGSEVVFSNARVWTM